MRSNFSDRIRPVSASPGLISCESPPSNTDSKSNRSAFKRPCSMRIRRYYFALDRRGEVISSMDQSSRNSISPQDGYRGLKRTENTPQVAEGQANRTAISRSNVQRIFKQDSDVSSVVNQKSSGSLGLLSEQSASHSLPSNPNLLYYSVIIPSDEEQGRLFDYTRDYRRYAYKDFSVEKIKNGRNIDPEALLKWVLAAKPRSQDDVYPIMQLCKGILKDIMEEKISCRESLEDALQFELKESQNDLKQKTESEQRLRGQVEELQTQLETMQSQTNLLHSNVIESLSAQLKERDEQIGLLSAKLEDSLAAKAELGERAHELERKLRSATAMAEQRAKDFFRAHNALTARLQMSPRETVGLWGLDEQQEALRCLLVEQRKCVAGLRAADLQGMSVQDKQELVKKILESIKVASSSWLRAVAEVFECPPLRLLDKVASWYEQENVTTDAVKYQQQVEAFRSVIEGTDLSPLYDIFQQGVAHGKFSVEELVFNCSGKSQEETIQLLTDMSMTEVQLFKENRDVILGFVQARKSMEAREKEEERQMKGLGFLHISGNAHAVDPMDVAPLNHTVARIFSRKITTDAQHRNGREPHLNIMRTTRLVMNDIYGGGKAAKLQIDKLVRGLEVHGASQPRLEVFRILAGMDPSKPWFERPSVFMMEFINSVAEGLWADQVTLVDFCRQNCVTRPELQESQGELDRIEWMLTGHDVRVPVDLLLKAALNACELHPCGYGYPRDRIQLIVQRASNPPAEYVTYQEAQLLEAKKNYKQIRAQARAQVEDQRVQAVVERLSRGDRRRSNMDEGSRNAAEDSPSGSSSAGILKNNWRRDMARNSLSGNSGGYFKLAQGSMKSAFSETFKGVQDYGVPFETGDIAWLDVFCLELLNTWFSQHTVVQAQMARAFDEFDENKDSNLSLDEFKRLVAQSPIQSKYSDRQLLHLYSELTSGNGVLTKHDWLSLFHHVEFDVLSIIRPRRNSMRRLLTNKQSQPLSDSWTEDLDFEEAIDEDEPEDESCDATSNLPSGRHGDDLAPVRAPAVFASSSRLTGEDVCISHPESGPPSSPLGSLRRSTSPGGGSPMGSLRRGTSPSSRARPPARPSSPLASNVARSKQTHAPWTVGRPPVAAGNGGDG